MARKAIEIIIGAKDEASSVFSSMQAKVAAVGTAIAGYFGIKAFAGGVQGAADLESQLSRVAAAADGGAEELAALRTAAEQAGSTTQFTATEAAGALENLVKAGLSANQAIGALPGTLALAQAGDVALAESAEIVTKAIAGMGLAIEDTARIADVLALGANATNSSVQSLAQGLSYTAPAASAANVSLEGTVALLGKMEDAGIGGTRAGTALSNMLAQFSDPAGKFRQELAAIGITTNDFEQALHQLAGAGARGEKAILAIGLNAGPGLRALLNQGMPALDALKQSLMEAEGSAAATAATMTNNLHGAMKGLGSAWDTVKNALFTPVLPVLKEGVDQLAESLRSVVSSGTAKNFGDAIAAAFKGGIEWARNFAESFNWDDILARLNTFAAEVQTRMDQIGQWATNAGNIVQTAWGVMAAGTNAVLAAVYKVGEVFATVVEGINNGAAKIAEKLSSITFGDVSKRFAAMAAEMRIEAGAFGAVADAFSVKAGQAFDAMVEHAESARDGFAALTTGVTAAAKETVKAAGDMVKSLAGVGDAAKQASDKAIRAAQEQAAATDAARAKVEALRLEYEQAVDTGNWQRAAELMQQIEAATRAAAGAQRDLAAEAAQTAAQTAAAFERAGIKTREQLADMARLARDDFELIKQSGQASAEGLAEAWKRAAEAAIAAADGTVPAWVRSEASVYDYIMAVDEAGKAVIKTADTTDGATGRMKKGFDDVRDAARDAREEVEKLGEGVERVGEGFRDAQGFSTDAKGNRYGGASDQEWEDWKAEWMRANPQYFYNGLDLAAYNKGQEEMARARRAYLERKSSPAPAPEPAPAPAPATRTGASASGITRGAGNTYVSNITIDGRTHRITTADAASQRTLEDLLRELADARATSTVH